MDIREIGIQEVRILPPGPGKCPQCAVEHDAKDPHDPQSLYYRMKFRQQHGRFPTWWDAMDHCEADTRVAWIKALKASGVDPGDPSSECPALRSRQASQPGACAAGSLLSDESGLSSVETGTDAREETKAPSARNT